jgi:hypothetical protein
MIGFLEVPMGMVLEPQQNWWMSGGTQQNWLAEASYNKNLGVATV